MFLDSKDLMARVRAAYPFDDAGYFYDGKCGSLASVDLSERVGIERLIRVTLRFTRRVRTTHLVGFTDHLAGWRGVSKSRKYAGVEVATSELESLVRRHIYFRSPGSHADNYYFTDTTLDWFALFCHEGDWHLYCRRRSALSDFSLA